ncbi:hypothetical protein F5Y15DRAFT_260399 [Xylariaceae sp. FL0016]|nr:hypothetical protein F5Y15DRAFT_260399 [Xylariaceae sp. FL0016]
MHENRAPQPRELQNLQHHLFESNESAAKNIALSTAVNPQAVRHESRHRNIMTLPTTLSRVSFALALLASTTGTYVALTPPNPNAVAVPRTGDAIRWLHLTDSHIPNVPIVPIALLALHTCVLACFHRPRATTPPPLPPPWALRSGAANGLNPDLITWSAATALPLALILGVGVPLRLVAYASLGTNFTFALAEPDRLTTCGVYGYVQHPSYGGVVALLVGNVALLARSDGIVSCWIPPRWYAGARRLAWALVPVGLAILLSALWTRVRQEEDMLRAEFGSEWEEWHARTARFIPGVF